jgi:hypothetical protein
MNEITAGNLKEFESIESLLDTDLTDLADLADFKVPAAGRYALSVDVEHKDINGHPAIVFNYSVLETLELANPEDAAPTIGDKFGENFNVDNEFGVGKLKKALKPYAENFSVNNIGELLGMLDGLVIHGTVKRREDKKATDDDGKPRVYGSVVNVEIQ